MARPCSQRSARQLQCQAAGLPNTATSDTRCKVNETLHHSHVEYLFICNFVSVSAFLSSVEREQKDWRTCSSSMMPEAKAATQEVHGASCPFLPPPLWAMPMASHFGTIFDPLNSKAHYAMDEYFDETGFSDAQRNNRGQQWTHF